MRGRVHTVRGKGKSAFIVLRQRTATVQVCLFANDTTVSKGMVKYASQIPRESIVDIEGLVTCPDKPVEGCSQGDVSGGFQVCLSVGMEKGDKAGSYTIKKELVLHPLCCLHRWSCSAEGFT